MKTRIALLFTLLIVLLAITHSALAQPAANGFEISRQRISGGGGELQDSGGVYTLRGIAAQPEGGAVYSGDGDFGLIGGYRRGGISGLIQKLIFLPLILR